MKKSQAEIKRGQAISFRIPSDTPEHLLKELQRLKEVERRNFSSKIAEFVMDGVNQSNTKQQETITIPLPNKLSKAQRDWIKHEHSEALLGSIIYQLLSDPVRATSLLANLNSQSTDIDEALYLQEDFTGEYQNESLESDQKETPPNDDDLDSINWEEALQRSEETKDKPDKNDEQDLDDLLGDFLSKMNK